ncbi:hypothetical protein [uncultured Robinsoniella sp.]|uniref:hypothetical protein n=1 Tax=uncultured Robinsoniella sp. TaxID=904190 RepID=UPI00374EB93D
MLEIKGKTVFAKDLSQVDLSCIEVPLIAVFRKPEDLPEGCVARLFDGEKATDTAIMRKTIEELRVEIHAVCPWMIPMQRGRDDVESLVEVWF